MNLYTKPYVDPIAGSESQQALDIAEPTRAASDTALFYVHGGGWYTSGREIYHGHLNYFSEKGHVCASAGYRTGEGTRLADKMQDVVVGYDRFVAELRSRWPHVTKVVVTGSSAGAHLTSLLALSDPLDWVRAEHLSTEWLKPAGCISVNGPGTLVRWPDMNESIKRTIERLVGASYEDESAAEMFRLASPDAYVNSESPPFLFIIVGHEHFFPHETIYRLSDLLLEHGKTSLVVMYPQAKHGFFYSVATPTQKLAVAQMETFIDWIQTRCDG